MLMKMTMSMIRTMMIRTMKIRMMMIQTMMIQTMTMMILIMWTVPMNRVMQIPTVGSAVVSTRSNKSDNDK